MRLRRFFLALILGAVLGGSTCAPRVDPSYREEIDDWKSLRIQRLMRDDGWLTLAGLFWLEPGRNTVGSDATARVLLRGPNIPAEAGAIVLENGKTRFEPVPGAKMTIDGRAVLPQGDDLASDENGKPSLLQIGTFTFSVIRRGDKLGVRVRDTDSAVRKSFKGLEDFPIDPGWRTEATFEPYSPQKHIAVPTILGFPEDDVSPGALVFQHGGKSYRLDPVFEQGSDELFIIFGDRTNGKETYGAGRFVYAPMPKNGKTVIDFNKAYSPPCIFTPYATCPFPPPQNRLPIEVRAGEKTYAGAHH